MTREEEEERLNALLAAKAVARLSRPDVNEVMIEFSDKTRLFVNSKMGDLDLSVTGGDQE
jgi:hypothetical protein